jgi:lipopolysaccharide exporter
MTVELGKHLGKGLWGLADKGLPVAYGLGYVFLVIRVLPEEEFGNFVLVQEIFLIISGLATAFALQPLLKFASEKDARLEGILGGALLLNLGFIALCSLLVVVGRTPLGAIMNSPSLAPLLLYLPAMLAASFVRNFTLMLLQSRFMIQEVFWTDAVHFLGAPVLIWVFSRMHIFNAATDLIEITILSLSASSLAGFFFSRRMLRFSLRPGAGEVKRLWEYGKYSTGTSASYLMYSRCDSFVVSAFGGPVQVAIYNAAKIFVRIYEMVTQVMQMFVLPAASRLSSQKEMRSLQVLTEKAILFGTVGLLPAFLLFLFGSPILVQILYSGRYSEAIPILQVFSGLSFLVPLLAVGSNLLLGVGKTRKSFLLGLHMLWISIAAYLLFVPWMGSIGAATGSILAGLAVCGLTAKEINRIFPLQLTSVLRRTNDIIMFARSRLRN